MAVEANGAATTKQSTETNNDLAAKLDNRYDLTHLIFEFLLSTIILISSFYTLIVYHDPNVSSGVVAIATLVISYWFGKSRPGR
jgi:hypothetical protein